MLRVQGSRRLLVLIVLLMGLVAALPAQAAPSARPAPLPAPGAVQGAPLADPDWYDCDRHKHITNWRNLDQIARNGFYTELVSNQGTLSFDRERQHQYLSLNVASNPNYSDYVASRITEIKGQTPIDQRLKCWQATDKVNVVAEFVVRFAQATPAPQLTENLILWNAPFPSPELPPEPPHPITAIGVTRSFDPVSGQMGYAALVVQDLDFSTFTGLRVLQQMPAWLDASDWHSVRVTISQSSATIEVAQDWHPYTTVLSATLLHPAEALGFEFSLDNQQADGSNAAVLVGDRLDVDYLDIHLTRAHAR